MHDDLDHMFGKEKNELLSTSAYMERKMWTKMRAYTPSSNLFGKSVATGKQEKKC